MIAGARHAERRALRVEVESGERAAPHTAGVESDDTRALHQPERGPVAEDDARLTAGTMWMLEPGTQRGVWRGYYPALHRGIDTAIERADSINAFLRQRAEDPSELAFTYQQLIQLAKLQ